MKLSISCCVLFFLSMFSFRFFFQVFLSDFLSVFLSVFLSEFSFSIKLSDSSFRFFFQIFSFRFFFQIFIFIILRYKTIIIIIGNFGLKSRKYITALHKLDKIQIQQNCLVLCVDVLSDFYF